MPFRDREMISMCSRGGLVYIGHSYDLETVGKFDIRGLRNPLSAVPASTWRLGKELNSISDRAPSLGV